MRLVLHFIAGVTSVLEKRHVTRITPFAVSQRTRGSAIRRVSPMTRTIDLVADVGEAFGPYSLGDDEHLLDLLTSANVACGFHAGDPQIMTKTVAACRTRGVAVGAHPGFNDLRGFGRRAIAMSTDEVRTDVLYQLGALQGIAQAQAVELSHVTPHGSLGNLSVTDEGYARGVAEAVAAFDPNLPIVTQEGQLSKLARSEGLRVAITAMADRSYNPDGSLVSRKIKGAVIHDEDVVVERAVRMVTDGTVVAHDGSLMEIDVDTVLLHGDNAEAVEAADRIRDALSAAGVGFASLATVLSEKNSV